MDTKWTHPRADSSSPGGSPYHVARNLQTRVVKFALYTQRQLRSIKIREEV
jgi:hypothetical protein